MFRLDYISCVLTISAVILLGKKRWQGWLIAGINSIVICDIAVKTAQLGFIPANLFCIALYACNIVGWRKQIKPRREPRRHRPCVNSQAKPGHVDYPYKPAPRLPSRETIQVPFQEVPEL